MHGNYVCPVCRATWKDLPFAMPNQNPNAELSTLLSLPERPPPPVVEPEPLVFSDDETLLTSNQTSYPSPSSLEKVTIKAIPERQVVAASDPVANFSVLVSLRGPSLPEDARQSRRAPIDLVTVLDISGSMHGSKLSLLKRAVVFVIDNMGPSDRISIVSFSTQARRILPLRRMTENGRESAKRAVNSLMASGSTNIVEGLKKGAQVLEERREKNPVASIIFLSDGRDTCRHGSQYRMSSNQQEPPQYIHLLPASIRPRNQNPESMGQQEIFPVHAFGFGTDHDPLAMHAISDASAGTFSFIESYEMVQDAFASCIGGLLSVLMQELRVMVRSASNGVEIKSIPSGRYSSEILNGGSQGTLSVGDLYADEEKEFLINLSVPVCPTAEGDESEAKTSLLDITCSYRDVLSKEMVSIECDLVQIERPKSPTPAAMVVNLEVDRQRNRLSAAESIATAQQMAESGNLQGAQAILSYRRSNLMASASGQAGDDLCLWLEAEMKETEHGMGSRQMYERRGRAYALSNMSSHSYQRAATRRSGAVSRASFSGYLTPQMANMVIKSQELGKVEDDASSASSQD